jgi:Avidin family
MYKNAATALLSPIAACLWVTLVTPAAAQPVLWTWTNEYGSTLVVDSYNANTGQISGNYTNQAAGSCDLGKPQGMNGWLVSGAKGVAISFAVNFVGCDSSTVWTGQLNSNTGFPGDVAAFASWAGCLEWRQCRC